MITQATGDDIGAPIWIRPAAQASVRVVVIVAQVSAPVFPSAPDQPGVALMDRGGAAVFHTVLSDAPSIRELHGIAPADKKAPAGAGAVCDSLSRSD